MPAADQAGSPIPKAELQAGYPPPLPLTAERVRQAGELAARPLIVLDDDPTGTQSVADLPVLLSWSVDDLSWALQTGAPAVYVLTNSRSLPPGAAAARNREVATNALAAAAHLGLEVEFVSRSDSTLRGHYPLEPDVLIETLADVAQRAIDGVIIAPAFAEAGRITVGSVHYAGSDTTGYVPVGHTEFARDASFGYTASDLREWVAEKSAGRVSADDVLAVGLEVVRRGPNEIAKVLSQAVNAQPLVVDIIEEADLRALALGIRAAQAAGKRYVYRVGPSFVRAFIGHELREPLSAADVARIRQGCSAESAPHGIVVVGSHVGQTTRQLAALRTRRGLHEIELDVREVLGSERETHLDSVVDRTLDGLRSGSVVVRTSRHVVTGADAESSLDVARTVSAAVVGVVQRVLAQQRLRFVVAKGGITSSDVASHGLGITRALVRGTMLPGIVSLWEPLEGPAQQIPYVVFAGNVGTDESLADVVDELSR